MTRPADFYERATNALHDANEAAWRETDPEQAVSHFTRTTRELLGDPDAPKKLGALKPGEKQFVVSGVFFIAPTRDHMILFADNFQQRHARISVTDSRPGHTVQTKKAAVVQNTDNDTIFRQILSSGRVGCSIYVPVMWNGEVIGMFNTAAQARYMFDETDMRVQKIFAALAAGVWMGLGGPALVADVAKSLGPWSG
ncbi:GAF domain-containing protein [Flaviflagellibacter deserti]|uniref:GAF domain-containing protein n=1 Tax=Flaviflagellibacter deserti TaxID=2267266 RepID=A0ABV9Z326_9HYPH